ncbi:ATP-binding protein [Microscilla marina]|uniref:AAA ATPase, central region n=1 Tax=Microscilla marina ATCC 23134 TaxID=313606 RepID=A1ZSV7_MICM2|nr:AAA family ATPase [Microscilla marina]EAY26521.1 AAA ATPase, central region [Microscilla marina ATCC 23134]
MKLLHHQAVLNEMSWLDSVIRHRINELNDENKAVSIADIAPVPIHSQDTHYQQFVHTQAFDVPERLLLALGIARSTFPQVFKPLVKVYKNVDKQYEFGGILEAGSNRFIPTLRTLFFLLSGSDLQDQFYHHLSFTHQHVLFEHNIMKIEADGRKERAFDEDLLYQAIKLTDAHLKYFLGDPAPTLDSDLDFPATLLQTNKTFDDLVLPDKIIKQLHGPMNYIRNYEKLMQKEDTGGKIKPGYVILLYGKPGTGKTMTASVMGNYLGIEVYYLNLSRVVSKYIGETEKNLEKVFNRLEKKLCILFVDEADALFGKRTEVKDSKDRYANQEVAYLLQRVERFSGVVILATNHDENMDEAFTRRILTHIHVPLPDTNACRLLWERSIPASFKYEYKALPQQLGDEFALTGGNISNIIKQACLKAEDLGTDILSYEDHLKEFIEYEFIKERRDFKHIAFEKIPDIVPEISSVVVTDNAPLTAEQQKQLEFWHLHLPDSWSYVPDKLPEYFTRSMSLSDEEIHFVIRMVWARHAQDIAKTFNLSMLKPGFRAIINDKYPHEATANTAWEQFKKAIETLLAGQSAAAHPEVAPENTPIKTEQNEDIWLSGAAAAKLWHQHLLPGFEFSPSSLPENISKFYEVKERHIKAILIKACTQARQQDSHQIGYSSHIDPLLQEAYLEEGRDFKPLG